MTFTSHYTGGDDDDTPPVIQPDADTPGPEAGDYSHPEGVPGDPVVDDSNMGG